MDLLKRISLSDRLVDEEKYGYEEFKYKLKSMPDFDNSFQIIEEERKESIKLLKEVLEK